MPNVVCPRCRGRGASSFRCQLCEPDYRGVSPELASAYLLINTWSPWLAPISELSWNKINNLKEQIKRATSPK